MNQPGEMSEQERLAQIRLLLDALDHPHTHNAVSDSGWKVTRIEGGANNLLYRAAREREDLAVKFCIRDERDRAGREFSTLTALREAGLDLAPEPLLLDRERYSQPVVVQNWIEGKALTGPPETEAEWRLLLDYFAALHTVTPDRTSLSLPTAFLNMNRAEEGKRLIRQQRTLFPEEAQPDALRLMAQRIEEKRFPEWPEPPVVLCHADSNGLNFLRHEDGWAAVDWEYSGWGDGAFEIADMRTHPFYADVDDLRWEWVIAAYAALREDGGAPIRIHAYTQLLNAWWAVRLARMLYEIPRGLDPRLVERPEGYMDYLQDKFERTLQQTETWLSTA
jgi:thiamine kinase-like enzyme